MSSVILSSLAEGSIIKLKENGVLVEFCVAKQNYESGLNGAGRVLVVRKNHCELRQWNSSDINTYASSTIDSWLNSTYKNSLDASIRTAMNTTKFYYTPGKGNKTVSVLDRSIFLLSVEEMRVPYSNTYANDEGTQLPLGVVNQVGFKTPYLWSRSPKIDSNNSAMITSTSITSKACTQSVSFKPAFTLPASFYVTDSGLVTSNTAPTIPGSISVPEHIQGGSTVTVSWGASTDAEGNLEGYIVERSTNGGSSWTQIYQGGARSTTNTVAFGTASVMFRVKAYDNKGMTSGYKTSGQVMVVNNRAPSAPSSIVVPDEVKGGTSLIVTWGVATDQDGNLSGYSLERQVNGGAWAAVYSGSTLSYTDTITKGWIKVAYRVRAYDSNNAYSAYVTSPERIVNNNTAPTIVCASPSGTDLGTKDAGFVVPYSVSDADADEVTVTEAIDGVVKRTYTATLNESNSFNITGEYFMKLLNGDHTLKITANDGKVNTVHTLTFKKEVTSATVTLETPMEADAAITICVLSVSGFIPADAFYKVEVTNNANDEAPAWEDCTAEVKNGANHIFKNKTAANGFAFNFRVTLRRGTSGESGYITSVQGGFQ